MRYALFATTTSKIKKKSFNFLANTTSTLIVSRSGC